jgi:DNA-binding LytR/AlgR family response regulator
VAVRKVASMPSAPLAGRRMLVIEDEYFLADDLARDLAALGAEILGPVGDFADAERIVKSETPIDAALVDINIKSELIYPLAHTLRARNVPFVFTTGYDRNSVAGGFEDVPVWEKPINFAALARDLVPGIRAG